MRCIGIPRFHPRWRFAWLLWPTVAVAALVTAQQVADAVRNSPGASAFLRAHADEVGALAIKVESGGDTTAYNGSCCYGVLQLNMSNILAAGYTIAQYRYTSLQEQVDAWSRIQSQALNDPVIQRLKALTRFDGQPVDAPFLLACAQLGQRNCQTMVQLGTCSGFRDGNGTTICQMAATMRAAMTGAPAPGSPGDVTIGAVARGGGSYAPGSLARNAPPDTAFEGASGAGMGQTADAIKLMAGALVLLWLAWASKATWQRFVDGGAEVREMTATMMRAASVALVTIILLS